MTITAEKNIKQIQELMLISKLTPQRLSTAVNLELRTIDGWLRGIIPNKKSMVRLNVLAEKYKCPFRWDILNVATVRGKSPNIVFRSMCYDLVHSWRHKYQGNKFVEIDLPKTAIARIVIDAIADASKNV